MTHLLVITDDTITLRCPPGCVECKEQEFIDRYGFESWVLWPSGRYPVSWWGDFYDGEWDENLGIVHPDMDPGEDYHFTPTPWHEGLLRGDISMPREAS